MSHVFYSNRRICNLCTRRTCTLFLFWSSPPCLQTQILQSFSQFVFFGQPQDIIVKLQDIQHSQVDSDCYCRYTFLYSRHGQWRASSMFRNLGNTQIPAQTSQFNLLSYNWHLLHQFSRQFGSHCILYHNQFIIKYTKVSDFIYLMMY